MKHLVFTPLPRLSSYYATILATDIDAQSLKSLKHLVLTLFPSLYNFSATLPARCLIVDPELRRIA